MKRIILGLVSILVLGGLVFGATSAFFSDTETSAGNVFTAGKIDLKIDHAKASYNGEDCDTCVEQTANLVFNGGFEAPEVTPGAQWDIFPSVAGGWNVDWRGDIPATFNSVNKPNPANIELHEGVLGTASEGDQYTELDSDWNGHTGSLNNEPASTSIYQTITTVPGGKYKLRFAFAPRPNTAAANNNLEVRWEGGMVHTTGPVAGAAGPIAWQEIVVDVIATGASAELRFTDLGTADSLGTFVDNVRLNEVLCGIQNGQCNLWETPRDLGDENDWIWRFDDIKPGDHGRNVLSMHVTSNDAWACILPENVVDSENVRIEPEEEAGDPTDGPLEGELSQFIQVFAWQDDNQNGIYEPGLGEIALYKSDGSSDTLFNPADVISVADSIIGDPLPGNGTGRYVGIAWCVGGMTNPGEASMSCDGSSPLLNQAQTDSMTVDITFHAEQVRNNPGFTCSSLIES